MLIRAFTCYVIDVLRMRNMCVIFMVCASVREDNSQALESGLSPLQMQNRISCLLHQHAFALCALQDN